MARSRKPVLVLMTAVITVLALTACARPGTAPPVRDDTQDIDHPDRGMTRSGSM